MNPTALTREWLALPDLGHGDRQLIERLGVTAEAITRAGGLARARIGTTGRLWASAPGGMPAFVLAVWLEAAPSIYCGVESPVLLDLIAWTPKDPMLWWYRTGAGTALGADALNLAHDRGWPITLATSPMDWLQGNCCGACLLGYCEAAWWEAAA